MKPKRIRCLVACNNSNGGPELVPITVFSTEAQIENGNHYDEAKDQALALGYDNPCWVTDEENSETEHLFLTK